MRKKNALARKGGQSVDFSRGSGIDVLITPAVQAQYLSEHHGLTLNRAALIARLHYGEDSAWQ